MNYPIQSIDRSIDLISKNLLIDQSFQANKIERWCQSNYRKTCLETFESSMLDLRSFTSSEYLFYIIFINYIQIIFILAIDLVHFYTGINKNRWGNWWMQKTILKPASIIESKQRERRQEKGNGFKIFMYASDFQPIRWVFWYFSLSYLNDMRQVSLNPRSKTLNSRVYRNELVR